MPLLDRRLSETCPEARFWVPDGGVEDYFFLTRVIQGQTETKYSEQHALQAVGCDVEWHGTGAASAACA